MVPNGWVKLPLSNVAEVRSGVAKGKTGLKDPITVPYLRVANVQDGRINLDEVKDIEIERTQLERYSLHVGDVLMNEGGDFDKLGRGDVWRGQISPCLHQNHVFAVRPKPEKLDSFFLAALAASNYGKTYFIKCSKRSTNLASINSSQIKGFPVLLPPIAEQKSIISILLTWEDAIATAEDLLANSRLRKKALMQKLLTGKTRLPGFGEEWKVCVMGDLLKEVKRPIAVEDENLYNLLSVKRRSGGVFLREVLAGAKILTKKMNVAKAGDFLISKMQVLHGASGIVPDYLDGFHISDSYISLTPKNHNSIDMEYFAWLSKLKIMYHKAYLCSHGVHIEKMTFDIKDFLKLKIFIPSLVEEQIGISKILSFAKQEIEVLEQRINNLKTQKKALMQQLLTGKKRVKVDPVTS